jgi:hypothetical protein
MADRGWAATNGRAGAGVLQREQQEFLEVLDSMLAAEAGQERFLGDLVGGGVDATVRFLSTQARLAYQYFSTQKYGCYCGKGTECNHVKDNLDRCCLQHDRAYGAVGVNDTVDMWTPLGFRRSRQADLALAACASRTRYEWHWYGPAAAAYREALIFIFTTRADIALALEALPSCIKDNATLPLWEASRLLSACG